jgi:cardiolipin synthase
MIKTLFTLVIFAAAPAAAQLDGINNLRLNLNMAPVSEQEAARAYAAIPEARPAPAPLGAEYNNPKKISDELAQLINDHPKTMERVEHRVIQLLAHAHARGMLVPALEMMLRDPRVQRFLPPLPPAKREDYIKKFPRMIAAQLENSGQVPGKPGMEPWDQMSERHIAIMKASRYKAVAKGPSLLSHPGYIAEVEAMCGTEFKAGHAVTPLVDGPASFGMRDKLMREAKKSIMLMTWGYYDDLTGRATRDLLIAKKRQGLDVKVMVDGNISNFLGMESLKLLEDAGVPVGRFVDPARPYDGMHSKLLIVDGEHAIAGGMNIGDKYSHMNPSAHKWRDTDVLFSGPAAADAYNIFGYTWNLVARSQGHALMYVGAPAAAAGNIRAALVYQRGDQEPAIYLSILKAIYGATASINIENAYFMLIPSLKTALTEAIARGVQVNILSNSAQTNNEPILTAPILESLAEMAEAGANVYVKNGETLHSKFMTVDGVFATVGSYNFHPKSIRHEREVNLHVLDSRFAGRMEAVFYDDLRSATRVNTAEQLGVAPNPLSFLARRYMFDQL